MININKKKGHCHVKHIGKGETFKYQNKFYIKIADGNNAVCLTGQYAGVVMEINAIVDVVQLDCTEK